MINLVLTTDKLDLVTSAAVNVDVHASWVDLSGTTVTPGKTNTAITTAATTDVVAAPAASTTRNVKTLNVRNKGTASTDVTVRYNANATIFELHKVALAGGQALEYVEGIGWFVLKDTAKLDVKLRVATDVVNATTSFADITGLTQAVESGKHYNYLAHLYHISNATTTGARFGINGPTMTSLIVGTIDTVTASVTASVHSAGVVAALDTAATAQTTGSAAQTLAIVSGWINPSAAGTFAMRLASEVAVASGLTVKAGSWLRLWEP